MSRNVILATRSEGKMRELVPMFREAGFEVITLTQAGLAPSDAEEAIEAFETFEDNAVAKARYFHERLGVPVVADDSGLLVDALGGAPGVRSKRWSGRSDLSGQALDDANNAKLLASVDSLDDRSARYVCAAAYVNDAREVVRIGETRGRIVATPCGEGGFGYDPYFWSDELGMTFGEATRESKEVVSHRGRAMRALLEALRSGS